MSTYLKMWEKIHALNEEQRNEWIGRLAPAKGKDINFYDVSVLDVDLLEALRNAH